MGRGNRKAIQSSALQSSADPVKATERNNDFMGIEDYSSAQVASETIGGFVSDGRYSPEELRGAEEAVRRVEELAGSPETRSQLHQADIPEKDLRCAEAIFTELGESVSGSSDVVAEGLDPEGVWGMDDGDHMYALAAYMRAIREGRPVEGDGSGLEDSRREKYAGIVDDARAQLKEARA